MLRFRIGNVYIPIGKSTKLRFQRVNPILSKDAIGGEYTFPFTLENSFELSYIINNLNEVKANGYLEGKINAILYDDENVLYEGFLELLSSNERSVEFTFYVNSSVFTKVKDIKLPTMDIGTLTVTNSSQWIEWQIGTDYVGDDLVFMIGNEMLAQYISTNMYIGLSHLADQINSTTFWGGYSATAYAIAPDRIRVTANWNGFEPELVANVIITTGSITHTASIFDRFGIKEVFNADWNDFMLNQISQEYPTSKMAFFPVLNLKPGLHEVNDETKPLIDVFYQNYWVLTLGKFIPAASIEVSPGYYVRKACVTPFLYLTFIIDKIAELLGINAKGVLHSDAILKRLCIWNNYFVDKPGDAYFQFLNYDTYTTHIELNKFLPDITIEELLSKVRSTLFLGFIIDDDGDLEIIDLNNLIETISNDGVIDLSEFELSKQNLFFEAKFTDFNISTEYDDDDEVNKDIQDKYEAAIFIGKFDTLTSLPETVTPFNRPAVYYALVLDTATFYMRKYNSTTFLNEWTTVDDFSFDIVSDKPTNALDYVVLDTLNMITENSSFQPPNGKWKVPYVKYEMSNYISNYHDKSCKLRLLYNHGLTNGESYQFPLGTSDGKDYNSNDVGIRLRTDGSTGLYKTRMEKWINFLLKSKSVDKYFALTDLQLRQLKFNKLIHSNGVNYLIEEIQEERPISGPTLLKLRKIELNG